jgi:hypothetical protein
LKARTVREKMAKQARRKNKLDKAMGSGLSGAAEKHRQEVKGLVYEEREMRSF